MTREEVKKLKRLAEEVIEFPDGSMPFRKHIKSDNGSRDGWFAIQNQFGIN